MGQQRIGTTPNGMSIREQLKYAIRTGKQMNEFYLELTAAEAILASALDPIEICIERGPNLRMLEKL